MVISYPYGELPIQVTKQSNTSQSVTSQPLTEVSTTHTYFILCGVCPFNYANIDKNGVLWLNYGDYRKEPSVSLGQELKEQVLRNFNIKEVGELDGSDVIIVGHVGISPNNKVIISTGFTKYLAFRKVKIEQLPGDKMG